MTFFIYFIFTGLSLVYSVKIESVDSELFKYISILTIQSLLWVYLFKERMRIPAFLLTIGLIFSFLCSRSQLPAFENDYNRYFIDGFQFKTGGNPYSKSPAALDHSEIQEIKKQTSYGELITIYPPLIQGVFALAYSVSKNHIDKFLWILTVAGLIFFSISFCSFFRNKKSAYLLLLLFLQHPLVMSEWFYACHYDIWFVSVLLWAAKRPRQIWLWALAAGFKQIGAAGLLLYKVNYLKKMRHQVGTFIFVLFVPYLPFVKTVFEIFDAVSGFAKKWEMNSGLFRLFRELSDWLLMHTDANAEWYYWLPRFTALGVWLGVIYFLSNSKFRSVEKIFWIFLLMPLLAPVANPWYFTWSLPFALFLPKQRRYWLLTLYSALPLNYVFFATDKKYFLMAWNIEHIIIWTVIVGVLIQRIRNYPERLNQ